MSNKSLVFELWQFLKYRKRFWLLPIILMLVVLSAVIVITQSSVVAPFIYALF